MDYWKQGLLFKLRKVFRYFRLYGLTRTLVKVRAQMHMRKKYDELPAKKLTRSAEAYIGVIGCGNFAYSCIGYYVSRIIPGSIRAAMDIDVNKAASFFECYGLDYYTTDHKDIVSDPDIRLVFIASNHASHAEYAVECLKAGKSVHIEKPHVVSEQQLGRLLDAMAASPKARVYLGFNRPRSPTFRYLQGLLDRQPGPLMINWFVAGHEIPDGHWYFDEKEGGRVLGNLCHWTDLTLHLVGMSHAFPCRIVPATPRGSKSDYVVAVNFAEGSCACITFSAKGHTFEGVREVLQVHRGDLLATLKDFHSVKADVVAERHGLTSIFRNHGHIENIRNSLHNPGGESIEYVAATARFFLAIRRAIESGEPVVVEREEVFGAGA